MMTLHLGCPSSPFPWSVPLSLSSYCAAMPWLRMSQKLEATQLSSSPLYIRLGCMSGVTRRCSRNIGA